MGADDLAEQLGAIADALGDLAFDALRQASLVAGEGTDPDPALLAEERRLTRARRAVEKAAHILRGPGDDVDEAS